VIAQEESELRSPPDAEIVNVVKADDRVPVRPLLGVASVSVAATFRFSVDEETSAVVPSLVLVTLTK
jgi:hypothetical protein